MAVLPTRTIEIEFDTGVWTDVSADLVSLTTRRGRNRELGAFETGQFILTLRNDTRKYDPEHTAGTYYGKLRPQRRVRFKAIYSAVTYWVCAGRIDRISQVYGGPNDATAVFQISDAFKDLNRAELPRSVYTAEVAADVPELWYRLDDATDTAVALNSGTLGAAYNGTYQPIEFYSSPGVEKGVQTLIVRDPGSAVAAGTGSVPVSAGQIAPATNYYLTHTGAWAVEFWARATAFGGASILQQGPQLTPAGVRIAWQASGKIGLIILNDAGTAYAVESAAAQALNTTYHFVLRKDADNTLHVLVDGVDTTTNLAGSAGTTLTGTVTPPWPLYPLYLDATAGSIYTIDELAIYKAGAGTALSTARAVIHNAAGRTPWNDDTVEDRLERILTLAGIGAGYWDIDPNALTSLQATDLGGTALAYAQKIEETEMGRLFVSSDGHIKLIGRNTAEQGAYLTPKATVVDDDSGAGTPYRSTSSDVDEQGIITRSTVSRGGSIAVTVYDSAAQTEFGWLDDVHDGLLHDDDAFSRYMAEWMVNSHKAPMSRVGTVTLELTKDPATMYAAILGLEIGDRVTYKRKPQNTGAVISVDMRVEAIAHETGPHYWRTRLQLSPFNIAAGLPVFVWDVTKWDQHVWGF